MCVTGLLKGSRPTVCANHVTLQAWKSAISTLFRQVLSWDEAWVSLIGCFTLER